jgi:glutathione peroxidase
MGRGFEAAGGAVELRRGAGCCGRPLDGGVLHRGCQRRARYHPHPKCEEAAMPETSVYDFEALSITGQRAQLASQRGRVILIVNTASACGFTPQFAGLEKLWQTYRDRGLTIVGFPSNEFGAQDPGANDEIASFCQLNYGVSFPMMAKVQVNGAEAHPLWQWLKAQAPGLLGSEGVKWNFTKFLVGKDGKVIKRYAPNDTPESLVKDIEKALQA